MDEYHPGDAYKLVKIVKRGIFTAIVADMLVWLILIVSG
jgi:hypothetical protein